MISWEACGRANILIFMNTRFLVANCLLPHPPSPLEMPKPARLFKVSEESPKRHESHSHARSRTATSHRSWAWLGRDHWAGGGCAETA